MTLAERIAVARGARCQWLARCTGIATSTRTHIAFSGATPTAWLVCDAHGTPSTAAGTHAYAPTRSGVCDTCGRRERVPSHGYPAPEWLRRGQTGQNRASDRTGL